MKVLIYSFEKFAGLDANPAAEVAKMVFEDLKQNHDIKLAILPTSLDLWEKLKELIDEFNPDLIIGLGLKDAPRIDIEYFALNMVDSPRPDNEGVVTRHRKINEDAPEAFSTSLDVQKMLEFFRQRKIPSKISYFPDTYVCNFAYFNCFNYTKDKSSVQNVFIHVPLSPELVNRADVERASYPPEKIAEAISDYFRDLSAL